MMDREELVSLALGRVRAEFTPSPDDKARLRAALGLGVLPGALPGASPGAEPSRWAALKASGLMGMGLGVLLLGGGVGLGFQWGEATALQRAQPLAAAIRDVVPDVVPDVAPDVVPELAPPEKLPEAAPLQPVTEPPRVARVERVRPPVTTKRSTARPLDEELALLRRVERALRGHDAALAMALLRELDQRFPETRLGEERLAARRMADCRQSSTDPLANAAASSEAQRFLKEHPASVYSERVQAACGFTAEGH